MSESLPATWTVSPINSLGVIRGGGTPSTTDARYWQGGTIPWVSPKDMKSFQLADAQDHITPLAVEESSTKLIDAGAVLLVIRSGILQHTLPVGIATVPVALNQDMKAIKPHPGIEPRFLAYGLIAHQGRILHECCKTGTTVQSVEILQLRQFGLPIAPSSEQVRIADRIDELFTDLAAGVAALERVKRNLSRYRAAVLHAAVTGRLTEAWRKEHGPPDEPGPKLLERILVERRRQWEQRTLANYEKNGRQPPKNWKSRYEEPASPTSREDAEPLAKLPSGWCWASVDECADVQGGLQKSPARAPVKNHYPYLRVANVMRGRLDLTKLQRFELDAEELKRLRLEPGDLLIVEGNGSVSEIGRSALWNGEVTDCVHQNHIIRCRFASGISPHYADVFVNSAYGQQYMRQVASSSSGLHTLSVAKIRSIAFSLPPVHEQLVIVEAVNEKLSQIDALEAEVERGLKRSSRLRRAILKIAFEGKLVPQDPSDEPANVLLERIRSVDTASEPARTPKPLRKSSKKTKTP